MRLWTALRKTGSDVVDIQDLYGHTDLETAMTPSQLAKHAVVIERLSGRIPFQLRFGWPNRLAVLRIFP